MYNQHNLKPEKTTLRVNNTFIGETIETKIRRIVTNKEPITDGAPLIFTDRNDGVVPAYDIRTDRFDVAVEAMDKVSQSHIAKRKGMHVVKDDPKPTQTDGGPEPMAATP